MSLIRIEFRLQGTQRADWWVGVRWPAVPRVSEFVYLPEHKEGMYRVERVIWATPQLREGWNADVPACDVLVILTRHPEACIPQ
jgi:hypothetical protein